MASAVLLKSRCEVLLTDVYSGYKKCVRETNEQRLHQGSLLPLIQTAYCNSHARRGFKTKDKKIPHEIEFMVHKYKQIYKLEAQAKGQTVEKKLELRSLMRPHFEKMRVHAEIYIQRFSDKSWMAKAFKYFLDYYKELTLFLTDPRIPIDNNFSERLLRSPVVGRKTWYGTHSEEGAFTAALHFSLIEACKINNINPRAYYAFIVQRIHEKKALLTPYEFLQYKTSPPTPETS